MQKTISLFKRDYKGSWQVYNEVVPGTEWVINGEGIATRKYDGTCCMMLSGQLYKRYDVKKGKTPPEGFIPAQNPDVVTGHWPGWLKIGYGPDDVWHRLGFENTNSSGDGTYELVGPQINGNKDGFEYCQLILHGGKRIEYVPRTFDELKAWLGDNHLEGIVWHHPDGRMVKIKKKDFGLKW